MLSRLSLGGLSAPLFPLRVERADTLDYYRQSLRRSRATLP